MEKKTARLVLQDGECFEGFAPIDQEGCCSGEVIFSTGMTGYVESLTDPSYSGQILTFTYPLIGNYGVPASHAWESKKIQAAGVIISEPSGSYFHHQAKQSLFSWLKEHNVPCLMGIDTRALTKHLRSKGVTLGAITSGNAPPSFDDPNQRNLISQVSIEKPEEYGEGNKTVIVIDCGMKTNILRHLQQLPIKIRRVPAEYDFTEEPFDALFISNGPGNPAQCQKTIALIKKSLEKKKPTFGICLGTQLLAHAIGAKTQKLLYGHRGHNQPCIYYHNKRCYLTSQNHGYAIDEETLPSEWSVTFRNLNDQSIEGIKHNSLPFFAVQFHPEAAPGPTDTAWLFDEFYKLIERGH